MKEPKPELQPHPKKFPTMVVVGIVLAAAALIGLIMLVNNQASKNIRATTNKPVTASKQVERKAVEQVFTSPSDGSKTTISDASYYAITTGNTQYYGAVKRINDDYLRLAPTAYQQAGALTFSGNELHGPEPITYFNISQVTKLQKLDAAVQNDLVIINAIKASTATASDAYPESLIDKYLKGGQNQAFFFSDGQTFFAKVSSLEGNFLANVAKVYHLQGQDGSPTAATQAISLALAKPEQYSNRTSATLQYWQNMLNDSKVSKAISDFERSH